MYLTHYSCVVIVLFNTALCRSAFSSVSFRKLVFRLSVLSLNQGIKMCHMIYSFILTLYKNLPFINNKLFPKVLQYYEKACFQRCSKMFQRSFSIKNSFMKKSVGQSKNEDCKKHYHSATKIFQVCIGIVYDSFILELGISIISIRTTLLLWRYCKIWTYFKTLVSKKTTIWWLKISQ